MRFRNTVREVGKLQETAKRLWDQAVAEIAAATTIVDVQAVRVRYLGKKGLLTELLRGLGAVPAADRPAAGKLVNAARDDIQSRLDARLREIAAEERARKVAGERLDVTLPGRPVNLGHKHPVTLVLEEVAAIFGGMGYAVVEGPEVELDEYNFELLNIPRDHPARDMQDSFYITDEILLRTQTSPMQVRYMRAHCPRLPVRIIVPGKTYRRDDDITHSPMFHQVEGLAVDRGITMGDLKGTLLAFAVGMFGEDRRVRLRPSYFPFTEPSAEFDVSCVICDGAGCPLCKHTGWLEILGAGMVHPNVLRAGGYDPEEVTGFAFGLGVERVAMLKYGIDHIRLFFTGDVRFAAQF